MEATGPQANPADEEMLYGMSPFVVLDIPAA
jgi:hypothetical protein